MSRITTGQLFAEWQQMNQKLLTQIEKQNEIIAKQQALIDRFNSPIDTQLTGSYVEDNYLRTQSTGYRVVTSEIALDSSVVGAGESKIIPIPVNGASKLIILVTFNKKWGGSISTLTSSSASDGRQNIFPNTYSDDMTPKSYNYPQRIIVGLGVHDSVNELEAINKAVLHKDIIHFILNNRDSEAGTAVIRVVRIWEG